MFKPKHPFRTEARNASVWHYLVAISVVLLIAALAFLGFNWNRKSTSDDDVRVFGYKIVAEYPHDPDAFTQGLLHDGNDTFYESTGLNGKSSVRKVDVKTGKVLQNRRLDQSLFGDGLTFWG